MSCFQMGAPASTRLVVVPECSLPALGGGCSTKSAFDGMFWRPCNFLLGCALVGSGGEILCCASAPCNLYVEVSAREPRFVIEHVVYLQRGTTTIITAYSKAVSTRSDLQAHVYGYSERGKVSCVHTITFS